MANLWRDIVGISGGVLQLLIGGVKIKNSSGELQARNSGDTDFADIHAQDIILTPSGSAFKLTVSSPALAADQTLTLPLNGTIPNQTGLHKTIITSFNQGTGATFNLDASPPANGTLIEVRILTDTAAAGGSPTLSVGVSGTPARDMATTENTLKAVGEFVTEPWLALGGSPAAIIATMSASAQTYAGRAALTYVMP